VKKLMNLASLETSAAKDDLPISHPSVETVVMESPAKVEKTAL
jgi:hypothetical protein